MNRVGTARGSPAAKKRHWVVAVVNISASATVFDKKMILARIDTATIDDRASIAGARGMSEKKLQPVYKKMASIKKAVTLDLRLPLWIIIPLINPDGIQNCLCPEFPCVVIEDLLSSLFRHFIWVTL